MPHVPHLLRNSASIPRAEIHFRVSLCERYREWRRKVVSLEGNPLPQTCKANTQVETLVPFETHSGLIHILRSTLLINLAPSSPHPPPLPPSSLARRSKGSRRSLSRRMWAKEQQLEGMAQQQIDLGCTSTAPLLSSSPPVLTERER
jgi:hypothetical protein